MINSLESPTATSHDVLNNPFHNILHQIQLDKIVEINTLIDICLPHSTIDNLHKPSPRGTLLIHNSKGTFEPYLPKTCSLDKCVFKNGHKIRHKFLRISINYSLHRVQKNLCRNFAGFHWKMSFSEVDLQLVVYHLAGSVKENYGFLKTFT